MTNDRVSGILLIAGSAGVIVTLGMHPSGRDLFAPGQIDAAVRNLIAVHSIALSSLPFWFLGGCGLTHHLRSTGDSATQTVRQLSFAALAIYGFALVAMVNAVTIDGLVSGGLARQIVATTGTVGQGWRIAFNYNGMLDQGFLRIFLVASSLAVALWSSSMFRKDAFASGLGLYGCVLAIATVAALLSGQLERYAHIFGIVLVGQAIWMVLTGVWLLRSKAV
jgi:hypothetical protein